MARASQCEAIGVLMARPKPAEPYQDSTLRLPASVHTRLVAIAVAEGRSFSQLCRDVLTRYAIRRVEPVEPDAKA